MAITRAQILDLGFKPAKKKKGLGTRKFDTLMYKINDNDYLYIGYNDFRGNIDFKTLWKSILTEEEGRISYPVNSIGLITYTSLKEYIDNTLRTEDLKEHLKLQLKSYTEELPKKEEPKSKHPFDFI